MSGTTGRWGRSGFVALVMAFVAAAPALAQEPANPDRWTFTFAPYLWAISLDGNARIRGVEADVDVPFKDAVKDLSFGIMGIGRAKKGRFAINLNGLFLRTSPDEEVGRFKIDATSDLAQLGSSVSYEVLNYRFGEAASGRPLAFRLEPLVGARFNYLRLELEVRDGPSVDEDETWVDPLVGALVNVDLAENWLFTGEGNIGGFGLGSDFTWNLQGYLSYRMTLFGLPTTLSFGYRALSIDYDHNEFKWDVVQQGPILGTSIQF